MRTQAQLYKYNGEKDFENHSDWGEKTKDMKTDAVELETSFIDSTNFLTVKEEFGTESETDIFEQSEEVNKNLEDIMKHEANVKKRKDSGKTG